MIKKYIIALIDNDYGEAPCFYAKFDDCEGTHPKREKAFVVDELEVDKYVEKAQKMANKMMEDAFLPVTRARQAVKWEI